MEWWKDPLFLVPLSSVATVGVAFLVTFIQNGKKRLELRQAEVERALALRVKDEAQQAELKALKIDIEIAAQRSLLVEQQRVQALASSQRTENALQALVGKQAEMATVLDATHSATNSSKLALETLLQSVRIELDAAKLAAHNAAILAAKELQAAKDVAAAEMRAKEIELQDVQRQLNTLALAVPPPQAGAGNVHLGITSKDGLTVLPVPEGITVMPSPPTPPAEEKAPGKP